VVLKTISVAQTVLSVQTYQIGYDPRKAYRHNGLLDDHMTLLKSAPMDRRRSVIRFLRVVLVFGGLVIAMFAVFQRSLIYLPQRVTAVNPEEFGWPAERCQPIVVTAPDGIALNGWLILADGHAARSAADFDEQLQQGRPLVLYFCGNGGHRGYRQRSIRTLTNLGCDVAICDYRGYGDNTGSPTEKLLIADAHAIWKYLTETRHVPWNRIIMYGESLGGGVATALAADVCRAGVEPGGLILQSTFPSLVEAGRIHFPWLPVSLLLIDRFPSVDRVPQVTCPVLQIHGRRDTIVPWNLGERLYAAIPAKSSDGTPKTRIELPHTDHNDVYDGDSPDRELLIEGLKAFIVTVEARR
jgi:uncharacterized protein